jgi:hypothetical protein
MRACLAGRPCNPSIVAIAGCQGKWSIARFRRNLRNSTGGGECISAVHRGLPEQVAACRCLTTTPHYGLLCGRFPPRFPRRLSLGCLCEPVRRLGPAGAGPGSFPGVAGRKPPSRSRSARAARPRRSSSPGPPRRPRRHRSPPRRPFGRPGDPGPGSPATPDDRSRQRERLVALIRVLPADQLSRAEQLLAALECGDSSPLSVSGATKRLTSLTTRRQGRRQKRR